MNKRIQVAGISHIGKTRSNNEDNYYLNGVYLPSDNEGSEKVYYRRSVSYSKDNYCFYAVFDGMGGGDYGEIASFRCCETTEKFFSDIKSISHEDNSQMLSKLSSRLSESVLNEKQKLGVVEMGSTMVSVLFGAGKMWMCNVGDSRCYWYKHHDGVLYQISHDHVTDMNNKAALTQYLGVDPDNVLLTPTIKCIDPLQGDKILLCSDGLTDMVNEKEILNYLKSKKIKHNVESLLQAALSNGGKDNTTLVVMMCI